MDLLPSQEQDEIVASIASLLESQVPIARVRELSAGAQVIDPALLAKCAELGWFTLGLPEALGGVGYGLAEEALLVRELGRHLTPGPFIAMILGARLAAVAGNAELSAAIASGTTTVGLAASVGEITLDGDGSLSAEVLSVDGTVVDLLLISAPDRSLLVGTAGASVADHPPLDPSSRVSTVTFSKHPVVASVDETSSRLYARGTVLTAAMLTGLAEGARDSAALHARERIQFGKPIGVNQAIKHPCTDMAVRAEGAACQTFFAAMTVDKVDRGEDAPDMAFQVAAAKFVSLEAAYRNSRADIQIHGGMGFTSENDSHLFLKRAHVMSQVFGNREQLLAQVISAAPVQ